MAPNTQRRRIEDRSTSPCRRASATSRTSTSRDRRGTTRRWGGNRRRVARVVGRRVPGEIAWVQSSRRDGPQAPHWVQAGRLGAGRTDAGRIESFLQEKVGGYSPQTLNHIRAYLGRAFSAARKNRPLSGTESRQRGEEAEDSKDEARLPSERRGLASSGRSPRSLAHPLRHSSLHGSSQG